MSEHPFSVLSSMKSRSDICREHLQNRIKQGIMANYTSTANVVLSVNGKQAQQMLSSLEKAAKRLEKQIE